MIIQKNETAGTTQIHWGVQDRQVFRSWERNEDLIEKEPEDAEST